MAFETILVDREGNVGVITINRPDAMNALSDTVMDEMALALDDFEKDDAIGCLVITGSDKVFAAGTDIKEMQEKTFMEVYKEDYISRNWERVVSFRKPVIAAVAGYAMGGGCELAMMCDFILAGENARFGQPEINLGLMPGAGGTQRLTRFVGKSKAMEMCLTGRMMDADEAERSGLVSRVVPTGELREEAIKVATKIAGFSHPIAMMTKEAVNRAYETSLAEGVLFERRLFHSVFATADKTEGMAAFVEKRKAQFKHR